jgi:hypothetical protein
MVIPLKLVQILIVSLMLTRCATVHGQNQNADLVAQAKKEGRVTWYTTVSIPESKQFMDMFEKQYPFDLLRSGSGALVNRIVSEYAAKNRRRVARYVHAGRFHRPGQRTKQERFTAKNA